VRISVVISTRNRPDALANCLAALGGASDSRTRSSSSTRASAAPADAVVERFRKEGLPIRYLPQPPRGLGAAQNAGCRGGDRRLDRCDRRRLSAGSALARRDR
jgi:hypothetical protein